MATEAGTAYIKFQGDFSQLATQTAAAMAPGKFGKLGKAAGGAFVAGIAAAGIGKALFDVGAEFDEAYDRIRTNTGKTGKELRKLKDDFRDVVGSVPADFDDASKAVSFMHQRLDIMGKPLQKISKQMLELSRITETDLQTNMEEATRVLADFGVKVQKQPRALDRLFKLTQATGVGFSDLASQMVKFGSPLRQLGFDFNTTAALFAKFTKEGVNIRTALPGLRLALGAFAEAGRDPAKALDQLLVSIKKAGSAQAAYQLQIKGLGSVLEIFGKRAGSDLVQAVQEGRFAFGDLVKEMKDGSKEGILPTAKRTRDAAEEFKVMTNRLKLLIEMPARKVFKGMGDAVAFLNRQLKTGGKDLPDWVKGMAAVAKTFVEFNLRLLPDAIKLFKLLASGPSGIEALGATFKWLKGVIRDATRGILGAFSTILDGMVKMADAGSKLPGPLGDAWDKVQAGAEDAADSINKARDSLKDVDKHKDKIRNVGKEFKRTSTEVGQATGKIRKQATRDLEQTARNADKASKEQAKDLIGNNRKWVNAVLGGHSKYAKEANKQFKSLGVKESIYQTKVTGLSESGRTMSGPGNQRGGFMAKAQMGLNVPGSGSGDKVHMQAMVEPGEKVFVLNRNASRSLRWLEELNMRIGRFQTGGLTGPAAALAHHMTDAFGGSIGSGLRPGDSGFHGRGMAIDWSGGDWTGGSRYANSVGPQLLEGIHQAPPGLNVSWDSGQKVSPSFWGSGTWADHIDHIHMAVDQMLTPGKGGTRGIGGPAWKNLARLVLKGPAGLARDAGQKSLDKARDAINKFGERKAGATSGAISGDGNVERVFAMVAKRLSTSKTATLALGEAGFAESGMRDLSYGTSSSQGALQLLSSTASGMGISPHNEGDIASAFFLRGFFGKGGANKLAQQGLPAHMVAQSVQGSATSDGSNYSAQAGPAKSWMQRFGLQRGGLVPRLQGGGTGGTGGGGGGGGGGGNGFQVPGFGNGKGGFIPNFLRRIKRGVKGSLEDLEEVIGFLVNDESTWGLPDFADKGMRDLQRRGDGFGEYAGIANTLTREVPIPETPLRSEGLRTILGTIAGGDEGHWLNRQLSELLQMQVLLINADAFIAGIVKKIQGYIAYAKSQLRIRTKVLDKLKKKLKETQDALKKAKSSLSGAKGDKRDQIKKNIEHLKEREEFFSAGVKGEQSVVSALTDVVPTALDSELSAGQSARDSILGDLDSLQGITGAGGSIFDTRQALVAFNALKSDLVAEGEPITTESEADSEVADLLRQLLDEERKRNLIFGLQQPVFSQFAGFFAGGGVVPGPAGSPRMIMAHGNEVVLTPEQAAVIGGSGVTVVVEDGAVDPNKIHAEVTRQQTRQRSRSRRMIGTVR